MKPWVPNFTLNAPEVQPYVEQRTGKAGVGVVRCRPIDDVAETIEKAAPRRLREGHCSPRKLQRSTPQEPLPKARSSPDKPVEDCEGHREHDIHVSDAPATDIVIPDQHPPSGKKFNPISMPLFKMAEEKGFGIRDPS